MISDKIVLRMKLLIDLLYCLAARLVAAHA